MIKHSINHLLLETGKEDLVLFFNSFKKIVSMTWMTDRSNTITMPVNCCIPDEYKLHYGTTDKSFKECLINRAIELDEHEHVYLMWSGGIDSTLMVISFLLADIPKNNITIACNQDSIRENPRFYQEHIRSNFDIIATELLVQQLKTQSLPGMVVQAEHADLILGGKLAGIISKTSGYETLTQPYYNNLVPLMVRAGWAEREARCFRDYISETGKSSPRPIETVNDAAWWFNFNFRWLNAKEKFLARIDSNNIYDTFYSGRDIQLWSSNNVAPIQESIDDKTEFRKIIKEYTKDDVYADRKIKWASMSKHFATRGPILVDSNNTRYYRQSDVDVLHYYNDNNFFKQWLEND